MKNMLPVKSETVSTKIPGHTQHQIVQPKLAINQPGDFHEREADRIADQVMGMKEGQAPVTQRMPITPVSPVQRQDTGGGAVGAQSAPPIVSEVLAGGGGQPLEMDTREFMEERFGQDFSNVRIHTDDRAAASARSIHALAYTSGNQVVFGEGAYSPGTEGARRLLAHELVHVGQQDGAKCTVQRQSHEEASDYPPEVLSRILALRSELQRLGIQDDQLGTAEGLYDIVVRWTTEQRLEALSTLSGINSGGGHFGRQGRVINAWNEGKDDLGRGRHRSRYPTILHFIRQGLNGEQYINYLSNQIERVRLAGGREISINARLIYFTAAAQAGMDERLLNRQQQTGHYIGGLSETNAVGNIGQGHYIPMGGFWHQLFSFNNILKTLAFVNPRQRRLRTTPLGNTASIMQSILRQLRFMTEVAQAQQSETDLPGYDHREHREPEMRIFLIEHSEAIRNFVVSEQPNRLPADSERLLALISDFRAGTRHHGTGSVDPHGTDHALGFAIDLYNGAGTGGGYRNVETNMNDFWPFIRYVMQHEPERIREIPQIDDLHELQPNEALELSALLADRGSHHADQIRQSAHRLEGADRETQRSDLADRRSTLNHFTRIKFSIYRELQSLSRTLARSTGGNTLNTLSGLELSNELRPIRDRFIETVRNLSEFFHTQLAFIRTGTASSLTEAINHNVNSQLQTLLTDLPDVQRLSVGHQPSRLDRGRSQRLLNLENAVRQVFDAVQVRMTELQSIRQLVDTAYENQSIINLAEMINSPGFRRWLETVSNRDSPLYDQPQIMVEAISSVRSHPERPSQPTFFYGGHHWLVASREVRHNNDLYESALTSDMNTRNAIQLRRILNIMAESEGGRQALFGQNYIVETPGTFIQTGDAVFKRVLAAKLGDETTETMLGEVYDQIVRPFMAEPRGQNNQERRLERDLRSLGIYNLND